MLLGSSIFLLPNGTFFAELILFLLIFGFVGKVILPPLDGAMKARAETVRAAQEASDEGQAEASRLVEERRQVLESARSAARSRLEQAALEAGSIFDEARGRGQAEHDRVLAEAQPQLDQARDDLVRELLGRVGELVVAAAGRVVGEPIDVAKHRGIIADAVGRLDDRDEREG